MKIDELKEKANQLRKEMNFSAAEELYRDIIAKSGKNVSLWDEWGLAYCLYKQQKYSESLILCEKVHIADETFEPVISLLGWNLYNLYVKDSKDKHKDNFFSSVSRIIALFEQDDEFSPLVLTIFKAIDMLNKQDPIPYEKIINYLLLLHPENLDNKKSSYKGKRGVVIELPSQKEKYYTNYVKALRATNRNEDAIKECDKALSTLEEPSIKTKNWFLKNKALAIADQNNYQEALNILLGLGDDWSVLLVIAEIYEKIFDYKKSLQFAIKCALVKIDPSLKIKCYLLICRLLDKLGLKNEIRGHINLIQLIYTKHKWRLSDEIKQLMAAHKVDPITKGSIEMEYVRLTSFWEKYQSESQEQYSGIISKTFPEKFYGFINSNNVDYFFVFKDFKADKKQLKIGTRVCFNLVESFNKKKDAMSKNAVNIIIEKKM